MTKEELAVIQAAMDYAELDLASLSGAIPNSRLADLLTRLTDACNNLADTNDWSYEYYPD